jgi:hypothetical protein
MQTLLVSGMTDVFGLGMADVFSLRMLSLALADADAFRYWHDRRVLFRYGGRV